MCSRATCRTCQKPTWRGCGNHIEQALAGVPKAERCKCGEGPAAASSTGGGFFSRLRGQ